MNTRCITLEGDDFNPGGTLTGGSRGKGGSLLGKLHELTLAEGELQAHAAALQEAETSLQAMEAAAREHKK